MFSSIIETVLTKFLGKYVDGIKNAMDINIMTGNATIEKISLRPEFINQLGLPFLLKYSHISKILINVPWANLKQKPTTVTVQGIYVLLSLKYDNEQEIPVDSTKKIKTIINRVKQEIKKKWQQKDANKSQTFAQKSIIRIIDNLIVNIDEIHVRVESMKRNWDFSFGVIMDKMSCFTINQYGQKTFYTRHFTNKEANPPLKKSFICQRSEIYFNDKEDFFMSEKQDKNKNQTIKNLLMQPFQNKYQNSPIKKKDSKDLKLMVPQLKQSYKMKNLSRFSFDIIAEQKLSSDKKYIVQVKGQLPKVCFQISDIQLSQILLVAELIYEWVIDKQKNGRKNNIYDQKVEAQFKRIILKFAKQQKITAQQNQFVYKLGLQTPIDKLETSADNLIRETRIQKQMKKINKAANKQKSKQLIQKLFQRMQNQNQQVMQLFEHIMIELNIPEFKLSCTKNDSVLLEIGLNTIMSDIKLILAKHTFVSMKVIEPFIKLYNNKQTQDLVILKKDEYMQQPFIDFSIALAAKSSPVIKVQMKKRYISLNSSALSNLISWVSCIRIKPPILNFINQQILDYSIHITQQIFQGLFAHADLAMNIRLEIPLLGIQLHSLVEINMGTLQINRQSQEEYCLQFVEKQGVCIQGQPIVEFDQGNRISLLNIKPQTVRIQLNHLYLRNPNKLIKFISQFIKDPILKQVKKLEPVVQQQIIFQGKFLLNQYVMPQNMLLSGNYLKFLPSGDSIYLLRTKMYPFVKKGQFGLIFRQQVQKQINIVLMDSQKLMYTLFETLKQHMLYICTIAQWKKYYQKFPNTLVTEVSQIQKQEQNINLIDLNVGLGIADLFLADTKLGQTLINLNKLKSSINYKQYNTDAKVDLDSLNISLGKQKLIENLSLGGQYSYKDFMSILINVLSFKLNVQTYQIIQQIINLSSQYSLMIGNTIKTFNENFQKPKQNYMLQKIANEQDISYLLQSKISMKLSNIQILVIGFRNMIHHANLDISKYRNNPIPNILFKLRQAVVMSSITLTSCQLVGNGNKVDVSLVNLAVYLSFQLLFHELTTGRGHLFLNSVLELVEARKKLEADGNRVRKGFPVVTVKCRGLRTRFRLTQNQQISTKIENAGANIIQNQTDPNLINLNVDWTKLSLTINQNMILQPLSGKIAIKTNKQFLPKTVTCQVQPIIINISAHKLIESMIIIKLSLQRIFNIDLIKSLLTESLKATNPRLVKKVQQPQIQLQIQCVKIILYNYQDWQLIRIKVDSLNLDTEKGKDNQIQLGIEHLNYGFRIYEPILQKTRISMCIKQGPQACIKLKDLRLNISQEFVKNLIKQLIITKNNIDRSLKETSFNIAEQSQIQNQLEKYKSIMRSIIVPEEDEVHQQDQEQKKLQEIQQDKSNTSTLFIRNHLKTEVLVEVKIDHKKTQVHLKTEEQQGQAKFKVRSQYRQSFEMIQKYKQIIIKLSIIHPKFYTQSLYFSVFLHKRAYNYHEAKFYTDDKKQIQSGIGIYIHQQQNSINYIMDIISPFKIINTTTLDLNLNWVKGDDQYQRQLSKGQSQWVSPWINDKVTINPNSEHLYATTYEVMFDKPSSLYEISLTSSVKSQVQNYCCLTIQRELFQLEKWHKDSTDVKKTKHIEPAAMLIKPTYFVINHFHTTVTVNDLECKHKQKVPLYSMFRTKRNESFFKIKFGDGSTHEIYLPKEGHSNSVELQLKNQNYVTISIHRQKSIQNSKTSHAHPQSTECIYHIYAKLQLLINFPKSQQLTLRTNILSTKYRMKKQLELNQINFEHKHPSIVSGNQLSVVRDRFNFHTYVHILDQFEKYLEIKSTGFYSKQVTLYPSYYGNDLFLYKNLPPQQKQPGPNQPIYKKYSINYQFTKINQQITMFYVSILPKYYILNLSPQIFNIDGQGSLKYNQRIVADSDEVQIMYIDNQARWELLHNSLLINLSMKKQVMFFKEVLFKDHQINQEIKQKKRREDFQEMSKHPEQHPKKQAQISQQPKTKNITISTQNIKIFQITKHIGSYSATTFCIQQWKQWIKIHNNLNKTIVCTTSHTYMDLLISIQTIINPGQVGNHPYGLENLPEVQFFICDKDTNQRIQLGTYQTHMRFNDEIELTVPSEEPDKPPRLQTVALYQVKVKKGRKIVFSFASMAQQHEQSNKKLRSLIIPAFLKISQSLKVTVENINASIIVGHDKTRRQLIRLTSSNIDLLLLVYPSGLYMIHLMLGLQLQAPRFPQLVLNIPNIQFYLQAIQSKFIQRVTIKIPKHITVFLTDKLLYQILDTVMKNIKQITSQKQIFPSDPQLFKKQQQNDSFYTSSLNSVLISQIHAKVTVKKVLIQNRENQQKLVDMGLSIIQLEDSGINLTKIDIDEPITAKHISTITKKYVMDIIVGCLGGLNLIGNPRQFMEEIQAGTSRGKPVIGFVGGVLAGTTNSMSKILSTVSNSVSQLSVDNQYHRQRNENYMNQGKGFANGVKQGGKSLFTSVKSGVVGLYKRPKQGLEEEGGIGLIKGTFSGLAGVFVKSVTGVIDAASMTVRGIKTASSYTQKDIQQNKYFEKPLYHRFKIIRPYDKIDEIVYNSLTRIFRQHKGQNQTVDIVQACVIEDEHNKTTDQAVIVTSQKLYVINYVQDKIEVQIPNQKMNATGKFLEGVVLYYNENDDIRANDSYDNRDNGQQIVFRVGSNIIKKERLYWTLKSFADLYTQNKDKQQIPE